MTPTIKSGFRTTEFWATVLTAIVGLMVTLGYIDPSSAHGAGLAAAIQVAAGLLAMVVPVAVYAISRALVKKAVPLTIVPGTTTATSGTTGATMGSRTPLPVATSAVPPPAG